MIGPATPSTSPASPGKAVGVDRDNPWPGLLAFREADVPFFHGRSVEAGQLLSIARRQSFTVLYGQSGLGKSSLLHAGLMPRLRREDYLPVPVRLIHSPRAPALSQQVRQAIEESARAAGVDAPKPRVQQTRPPCDLQPSSFSPEPFPEETLWEYLHYRDNEFWGSRNQLVTPVLIFDQFEEIFTLGRETPALRLAGEAFAAELADLADNLPPQWLAEAIERGTTRLADWDFKRVGCKIVLALREDFIPDFDTLQPLKLAAAQERMRLVRMRGPQALEVILGAGGHLVAPPVAAEMVRFVAGAESGNPGLPPSATKDTEIVPSVAGTESATNDLPAPAPAERVDLTNLEIDPALLSLFCRELNNERRCRNEPQITSERVVGSRGKVIANFYKDCVRNQPPLVREFIEDRLLTATGRRELVSLDTALTTDRIPRAAIDALIDQRLLRLEDHFGVPRLELTHDVLAPAVKASRDARQEQEKLAEAQRAQREDELLKREATEKLQQARKRWQITTGASFVIVLLSALSLLAVHEWWRAVKLKKVAAAQRQIALETMNKLIFDVQKKLTQPGTIEVRRDILQLALDGLQKIDRSGPRSFADRDTAVAQSRMADIMLLLGKTGDALDGFERAELTFAALATSHPSNVQAQRDLSDSYNNLGKVALQMGDAARAKNLYDKSLVINEALAKADPGAQAQRDLSVSYSHLGDVTLQMGDAAGARSFYAKDLAVAESLARADPGNAQAQSGLSISYNKLGNVTLQMGDSARAEDLYAKGLIVAEALAKADPGNAQAQRDLSVSYNKLGNVTLQMGKPAEAKSLYAKGLIVAEALAKADPGNAQAQSDLSISYNKLGNVTLQMGDSAGAKSFYLKDLAVAEALAKADPGNAHAQSDLSFSYNKLGNVTLRMGDAAEAKNFHAKSLAVRDALAKTDPANVEAQTDVMESLFGMGTVAEADGEHAEAAARFERGLGILRQLEKAGKLKDQPEFVEWKRNLEKSLARAKAAAATQPSNRPAN